jgi:hypothetical protein
MQDTFPIFHRSNVLMKFAFHFLLVLFKVVLRGISTIALLASNTAQVFGHVPIKRNFVPQNFAAISTGRSTQVHLKMTVALGSRGVRLLAHPANKHTLTLQYHASRQNIPRNLSQSSKSRRIT